MTATQVRRIASENKETVPVTRLLQQGVWLELGGRITVSGFACSILNIDDVTFSNEVKTIILNNDVVDDPDHTELYPGDTLVLSGAMPGLVGAMLRSGSPIKVLRSSITAGGRSTSIAARSGISSDDAEKGLVKVKLFNTVLRNHGKDLLSRGFFVEEGIP